MTHTCRHLVVARWRAWLICVDRGRLLTYDGTWT
jgi:hypothetical protein